MRTTILIGLLLVFLGGMALYQVRNGFFMSMIGRATYAPPEDETEIGREFALLAATPSRTPGVTLQDVAEARLKCALKFNRDDPAATTRDAFVRLNLMLLGVGVDSFSPVIDPQAFRVTELRRNLTQDTSEWQSVELSPTEKKRLDGILSGLLRQDHPAYADLDFSAGFAQFDFISLVNVMLAGREGYYNCVAENRAPSGA